MNVIRSHKHDIYTEEINKIALSAEDEKRVVLEDGIKTLAFGHYKLQNKLAMRQLKQKQEQKLKKVGESVKRFVVLSLK